MNTVTLSMTVLDYYSEHGLARLPSTKQHCASTAASSRAPGSRAACSGTAAAPPACTTTTWPARPGAPSKCLPASSPERATGGRSSGRATCRECNARPARACSVAISWRAPATGCSRSSPRKRRGCCSPSSSAPLTQLEQFEAHFQRIRATGLNGIIDLRSA